MTYKKYRNKRSSRRKRLIIHYAANSVVIPTACVSTISCVHDCISGIHLFMHDSFVVSNIQT